MDYPRTHSYTYDASGNITDDGVREYVWDSTGRLKEVQISSSTVGAYTYNAYNQRTKKVAGTTTHYVYGAGGLLYGEYDNAGDLIREYVYLNGAPLAQINAGSPEVLTYLHPDHLGTPKFGTNAGGTQVWSWTPDAFGNGAPSGSVTVNLRMPGQYFDAESGLFYNWNRYYNPAIGRYISSDPIGLAGGINTFLYAAASPVMFVDWTGEDPVTATFGATVAAGHAAIRVRQLWQAWRGYQAAQQVIALSRPAATTGSSIILTNSCPISSSADQSSDETRQREYDFAKNFCDSPPPKTGNKCSDLSREIDHAELCVKLYEAWDLKWEPERHTQKIQDWKNRISNKKREYSRQCVKTK